MKLLLPCVVMLTVQTARAQEAVPATETKFAVEWNASLAAFLGIGGNVGIKPAALPHVRAAIGGFTLTLPQFALDAYADMGWTVTDRAALAEGRYYLRTRRGGLYGSLTTLYQHRTITRSGVDGDARVHQFVIAAAIGYEWFPFANHGFYVTPNFLFAVRVAESKTEELGGERFEKSGVLPLPGLLLGWQL